MHVSQVPGRVEDDAQAMQNVCFMVLHEYQKRRDSGRLQCVVGPVEMWITVTE